MHGLTIVAANARALNLGLAPGLALADARARVPTLLSEPIDRRADRAALGALADWCLQWSPSVALDAEDGLLLDTTGTDHLVGGEEALLDTIRTRLAHLGFTARLGLADTGPGAAALARFATGPDTPARRAPAGQTAHALAPLPVESLRLLPETALLLRRLGLKAVGDLMSVPRLTLARRFARKTPGEAVLHALDGALGFRETPLRPRRPAPDYRVRLMPLEPLVSTEGVLQAAHTLMRELCRSLARDGRGARRLTLLACRSDGSRTRLNLAMSEPSHDARHLMSLLAERLVSLDAGFGLDALILAVPEAHPLQSAQHTLTDETVGERDPRREARLVDRLINRLGADHVTRLLPQASHIPEWAVRPHSALETDGVRSAEAWAEIGHAPAARPLRLLPRPEPIAVMAEVPDGPPLRFTWRRVARRVVKAAGPERIAPEWWHTASQAQERTRDYYTVEDETGRRYWLYRDGLYCEGGREGPPTWYVHGLFS